MAPTAGYLKSRIKTSDGPSLAAVGGVDLAGNRGFFGILFLGTGNEAIMMANPPTGVA